MKYAHPFTKDGVTHVVLSSKAKVSRSKQPYSERLLCGPRLTPDFQRRGPSIHRLGLTPATCDACVRSMTGLMDIMEQQS